MVYISFCPQTLQKLAQDVSRSCKYAQKVGLRFLTPCKNLAWSNPTTTHTLFTSFYKTTLEHLQRPFSVNCKIQNTYMYYVIILRYKKIKEKKNLLIFSRWMFANFLVHAIRCALYIQLDMVYLSFHLIVKYMFEYMYLNYRKF